MAGAARCVNHDARNRLDGYPEAQMTTSGEWGGEEGRGVTVIGVGGAGSNAVAAMSRYASHGLRAAEEAMPEIMRTLRDTGLCIVAAGLGGGTGTGAAPIIAAAARACGA